MWKLFIYLNLLLLVFGQSWSEEIENEDRRSFRPNLRTGSLSPKGKRVRAIRRRTKPTESPTLIPSTDTQSSSEGTLCLTKGCIKAANSVLESINSDVNPCDDFYEYACGSWIKQHVIPGVQESYSHFTIAYDDMQMKLKSVLEDTKGSDFRPSVMARDVYKACMNETAIEDLGRQPLIEALYRLERGWPVLIGYRWDEYSFDWITTLADLSHYAPTVLIINNVQPDSKNTSQNIMNLDQHTTDLMVRDYFLNEMFAPQRAAYLNFMRNIFKLLNFGKLSNYQDTQLREILEFEIKLIEITTPLEERRDENRMYNKMTVDELQRKYQHLIDFRTYFDRISPEADSIMGSDFVKVSEPLYFEKLGNLIAETSKRVVANFLGWQFILTTVTLMPENYWEAIQKLKKILLGVSSNAEHWRTCVDFANNVLPEATGKLYVDSYFDGETKKAFQTTVTNLRKAFRDILLKVDWMDLSTKKYAAAKLKAVTSKIGYPPLFAFPKKLDERHEGLNVQPDKHFANFMNISKYGRQFELQFLHKPVNKMKWYTKSADINAYYFSLDNSIIFPAAIIKPPFFDIDRPKAMDYGSIGVVIGHELTHGFDDQGRRFDKTGNLRQWWSPISEKKFDDKTKCLIEQYNGYHVPEVNLNVNGIITQGENIADNAGVKEAFMAYKTDEERNGRGLFLPGVNVTHDQLFFLSFAQTWCTLLREEKLVSELLSDNHSPNKFRVNGPLSNFKQFFEAFNCSTTSKMYREKTCSVW